MSALAEHAVDSRVVERGQQAVEHRAPVGHRQRVVAEADHRPRRVVGGDDEQHAVVRQRSTGAAARRAPRRSRPARGRGSSISAANVVGHPATRRVLQRRDDLGHRSASRPRTAVATPRSRRPTLAYSTMRTGSQPDSSPCTSAPPNASPAPRPHTTSTRRGGTTVRARRRWRPARPSPPSLTMASSTPRSSSRRAASSGSAVPTATSHSARLPTATVHVVDGRADDRRSRRLRSGQNVGAVVEVEHGVRAGAPRSRAARQHVVRAGSSRPSPTRPPTAIGTSIATVATSISRHLQV